MFDHIDRALSTSPRHNSSGLALAATLGLAFGLRPAEGRQLLQFVKFDHVTREELHRAMYDGTPTTGIVIADVTLGQLRRRLAPHDIRIITIQRRGYRLTEDSRDKIRKVLAAYGAEVIAATAPAAGKPRSEKAKAMTA